MTSSLVWRFINCGDRALKRITAFDLKEDPRLLSTVFIKDNGKARMKQRSSNMGLGILWKNFKKSLNLTTEL